MIAVMFELWPAAGRKESYFELATRLKPQLQRMDGFLSIERFESLSEPGKFLSLSFWRDEAAVAAWRNLEAHRAAQARGRAEIFAGYRLRVAHVLRDYSQSDRDQAPEDSRAVHALDGISLNRRCGSMDNPSLTRGSDTETLRTLNDDYIQSVQRSDVRRFEELLAGDFQNSNPDGSLVDRAGFLAQIAAPATITSLKAEDVRIRVLGDFAIIHARTAYVTQGGRPAAGRYTDIWARREGRWLCIAAHVTRA